MALTGCFMPFRVTFFFSQQVGVKTGGWSENFWNSAPDLPTVTTAANALLPLRFALLGYGVGIVAMRFQDLTSFRAAQPIPLTQFNSVVQGGNFDADYPTTKGLLRLFGPAKYITSQWLGGMPDSWVANGGVLALSAVGRDNFLSFKSALLAGSNGWRINNQDKSIAKKLVTAVTAGGQVTAPGSNYTAGQIIRISRTHGVTGLNKLWTVATNIDPNTFTIAPPVGGFVGSIVNPLGTAQLQSKTLQAMTDVQLIRATEHRVGRPFGLLSGRRKRRAS